MDFEKYSLEKMDISGELVAYLQPKLNMDCGP